MKYRIYVGFYKLHPSIEIMNSLQQSEWQDYINAMAAYGDRSDPVGFSASSGSYDVSTLEEATELFNKKVKFESDNTRTAFSPEEFTEGARHWIKCWHVELCELPDDYNGPIFPASIIKARRAEYTIREKEVRKDPFLEEMMEDEEEEE